MEGKKITFLKVAHEVCLLVKTPNRGARRLKGALVHESEHAHGRKENCFLKEAYEVCLLVKTPNRGARKVAHDVCLLVKIPNRGVRRLKGALVRKANMLMEGKKIAF